MKSRFVHAGLGAALIAGVLFLSSASADPLQTVLQPVDPIETDSGLVAGKVLESGVRAWFGVPYAQAPLRELRWRPPQPIAWAGTYNADRFAPECIQPLRGTNINHYFGYEATSEDCLYLNIWAAPHSHQGDNLPVVVWIHGGGFTIGSAAMRLYAGENLAKKGIVYVSIGYRVGAMGFMASPELTAESPHKVSGNYGLLDQVAALQWIQRNIGRFGGDRNRVTIMGQSAGSASASLLQVSPLSADLFHGVVGLSGAVFGSRKLDGLKEAEQSGLEFEKALGVTSITGLRQISADRILALQQDCQLGCSGSIRVGPIVDGYYLPAQPSDIFERGEQHDVPIMIGFTHDEGFSAIGRAKSLEEYRAFLKQAYGDAAEDLLRLYPASTDAEARRAARDVARDSTLGLSMYTWASMQAKHGKQAAFPYLFARVHPYVEGVTFADHDPATVGAYHTGDVPYWLQTLDSLNLFRQTRKYTPYDRQLADLMSDSIIAFATRGNPSTKSLDWPKFDARKPKVVELGASPDALYKVVQWPNTDKLSFFAQHEAGPVVIDTPGRPARD